MGGSPPTPEELARWLLSHAAESHATSEEITMAAVSVYERMRAHLALLIGFQGFDALWERALHLVQHTASWPDTSALPSSVAQPRLDTVVQGRDAAEAYDILVLVFTRFLELLFTFIGADLGSRLLHQPWLALPMPMAPEQGEEMQP